MQYIYISGEKIAKHTNSVIQYFTTHIFCAPYLNIIENTIRYMNKYMKYKVIRIYICTKICACMNENTPYGNIKYVFVEGLLHRIFIV